MDGQGAASTASVAYRPGRPGHFPGARADPRAVSPRGRAAGGPIRARPRATWCATLARSTPQP